MGASFEELKVALSALRTEERAELAQFLLGSLEPEEGDARRQWPALAERRMADVRAGRVVGIPAEEVLKSLPGAT